VRAVCSLEVPANADFVIEGYVDPTEPLRDEGLFGNHTGYYTLPSPHEMEAAPISRDEPYPVFHVTAIIVGMIQGGAVAQRRPARTANRVHRRRAALRGDPGVDGLRAPARPAGRPSKKSQNGGSTRNEVTDNEQWPLNQGPLVRWRRLGNSTGNSYPC
jgi:hypothetical protein